MGFSPSDDGVSPQGVQLQTRYTGVWPGLALESGGRPVGGGPVCPALVYQAHAPPLAWMWEPMIDGTKLLSLQGPKRGPLTLSVPVKPLPCQRGEGPGPSGVCEASDLTSGSSIWDPSPRSRGNNVLFTLCFVAKGCSSLAHRQGIVNSRNFSLALPSHLTCASD